MNTSVGNPGSAAFRWLLFVCTGNYYRSRFAEAVFNHHVAQRGLGWRAFSRGLAIHEVAEGDLSEFTLEALAERGIDPGHTGPSRVQLAHDDLARAEWIIALDELEHRPMVARQFPDWECRFTFWEVRDRPWWEPEMALPMLETRVLALVDLLAEPERKLA